MSSQLVPRGKALGTRLICRGERKTEKRELQETRQLQGEGEKKKGAWKEEAVNSLEHITVQRLSAGGKANIKRRHFFKIVFFTSIYTF